MENTGIVKDAKLAETEARVFSGWKKLHYDTIGDIYVKFPTLKEEADINLYYSEVYNKLLASTNLPTQHKMKKILAERGEWTEEDEQKLDELQELYLSKAVSIEQIRIKKRLTKTDKESLEQLEKEQNKIYTDWITLSLERGKFFENTIESQAEQEAIKYKMVKCVFDANKNPLWESIDELQELEAHEDFGKILSDCLEFWRGESVPFFVNLLAHTDGKSDIEQS